MIIEGKHSELGQGIFISDIQEGSNADKVSSVRLVRFSPIFLSCLMLLRFALSRSSAGRTIDR